MGKDPNRLLLLGEIISAYGIKGEVRIKAFTSNPLDIASYGPLSDKTGKQFFTIQSLRFGPKGVIARLSGVSDRTTAEKLIKQELYIQRSRLPVPETGSYYHADLIGLKAYTENSVSMGHVVGILNFGAGDLLEISLPQKKETLLIPFKDPFVSRIDLIEGKIFITPPQFIEISDTPNLKETSRDNL